jgi:hypothetical protein
MVRVEERSELLLGLSALLTGFDRVQLFGTGMIEEYSRALEAVLPAGVLDELLTAYERLPAGDDREGALAAEILGDPKLGPVARNVILLWYLGAWAGMPDDWRAAYGTSRLDDHHVISAAAYQAGLQWVAAGAHPAGSAAQGFGSWAAAPEGSLR